MIKIWVDDIRSAPYGFLRVRSVDEFKDIVEFIEENLDKSEQVELIDLDHDAGDYVYFGGDYIKILEWLEKTNRNYPIRLHSMNSVGIENMRRIIQKNGWTEVK